MPVHQVFLLLFSISSCLFINIQSRHHSHAEQEQFHIVSHISVPPSPAPEAAAACPSYSAKSPNNPYGVFNVFDFGATGDGVDTQAFKLAWDMACQNESEVLLVPDGYSFMLQSTIFTGPCKTADLVLHIDGTIMPPDGPDSWPRNRSKRQWLVFYRINGMAMQGGGLIDGRGEKWWNLPCKPHKWYSILTMAFELKHGKAAQVVSKVKFHNIRVNAVRNPIIIDQYYCLAKNGSNQTSAAVINDISYSNIKGTYNVRSPPMRFACSDSIPCTNLTLAEVELLPALGQIVADPFCWNAYGNVLKGTIPPVYCLMEERPQSITHNYVDSC
ncbi:hypothetical protein CRYUN_Cryun09bG0170600 [Craigia yunnanensis]